MALVQTIRLDRDLPPALAAWRATPDAATGVAIPGTGVAVFSAALGGAVSYVAGVSDLATGNRLTTNDTFRLASVSKLFTAGVVMKLDTEGRLALSDPLAKHLVWPNGENITVEMLLSHTSGIPNELESAPPGVDPNRDYTPRESLEFVAEYGDPNFAPGTLCLLKTT